MAVTRLFVLVLALVCVSGVAPAFAQATPPAGAAAAQAAVQTPIVPLPAGARIGFVNLQVGSVSRPPARKARSGFVC